MRLYSIWGRTNTGERQEPARTPVAPGWLRRPMDAADEAPALVLMKLGEGCPALTPDCGRSLAEAAAVCLEDRGHGTGIRLIVVGQYEASFSIVRPIVTDQMRRCYNDPDEATENG